MENVSHSKSNTGVYNFVLWFERNFYMIFGEKFWDCNASVQGLEMSLWHVNLTTNITSPLLLSVKWSQLEILKCCIFSKFDNNVKKKGSDNIKCHDAYCTRAWVKVEGGAGQTLCCARHVSHPQQQGRKIHPPEAAPHLGPAMSVKCDT